MSQQSARAAWSKSSGDAEGSKPEAHGTIRANSTPAHGSESQKKSYGAVASTPSQGGANAAGKDSSNCDDALGTPGKFHGSQGEVKEKSGEGLAEVKKQQGEITDKYPKTSIGYN